MIAGLNITLRIDRDVDGIDDEVGGATVTTITVASNIRARISSLKPSEDLRAQGIESTNLYNCVIWPASVDVRFNDYIIPQSGDHSGKQFRVLGTQIDSLPSTSPRAHISVRLQRIESSRSVQ